MPPLEALTREAVRLAGATPAEVEADRMLTICNACRYCEGFCAVFPAMTRRLTFPRADLHYLANLCHNCGACLFACQYAPPHEFAVAIPQALSRLRTETWTAYAWPGALGALYRRAGLTVALALGLGLALFLVLAVALNGALIHAPMQGNFYAIFPHGLMVGIFGPVFGFACLALAVGAVRFWRLDAPGAIGGAALGEATHAALTLKYLDGGHGLGCNEDDDRFTRARRHAHHLTFYGFLLCFASTSVATLYHYAFGWPAPYALTSLPVLLGTLGGVGLLIGPAGLWWLNRRRHPLKTVPEQSVLDLGFIALLFLVSLTGLLLLALRDTAAMALFLAIHLGFVLAFFLTMPYGKFAHGLYRGVALLKWAVEKRLPSRLRLKGD